MKIALCLSVTLMSFIVVGVWVGWQGIICALVGATAVVINEEVQKRL